MGCCWVSTGFAADPLVPTEAAAPLLIEPANRPIRLWIFDVTTRASAGVTYDDNISLAATDRDEDFIWRVSPGVSLAADQTEGDYGKSLRLDFEPSFQFFTEHRENDAIDYVAGLNAAWRMARVTLGLNQGFSDRTAGVAEVGNRVQSRQYTTGLNSRYHLGEKTSVELNPRLTISENETQTNAGGTTNEVNLAESREWGVDAFVNRELASKITLSLGGSGGYIETQQRRGPNSSQTYERALARVTYALAAKVDLNAVTGMEWRQSDEGSGGPSLVFGLGGNYRPWESTALALEAHRREQVSIVEDSQNYTTLGVTASIRQVLWGRFFIDLSGAYENRDYEATAQGVAATRQDDYYVIGVGVGASFATTWTAHLSYQYQENVSSENTQSFNQNQVSLKVSWVGF